jgi:FkbM family methyltransferase
MRLPRGLEMSARRAVGALLGPALRRARLGTFAVKRATLLHQLQVAQLIDVGANIGQYAAHVRLYGYRGAIHSFEPLSSAFAELSRAAAGDPQWHVRQVGLGRTAQMATLHVAANSQSSSLLEMLPRHLESAPESAVVGSESVELVSLAEVIAGIGECFVKIDAQGAERQILEGGGASLDVVQGLELELSLVPLYAGETLFAEMVSWLATRGFDLHAIGDGLSDRRTGAVLQVDALFVRRSG